ncbi:MAG: serine hydrolase [Anaerolineae bacterium]|nr:serine hydrolase [Anaerolineae bacterium]
MKRNTIRPVIIFLIIAFVIAVGISVYTYTEPKLTLFHPDKITNNFAHMDQIFPSRIIHKSTTSYHYFKNPTAIPTSYVYDGQDKMLDEFLTRSKTTGLLVIQDDTIVYEEYFEGYDASTTATSYSVAKSFISTLVGIAIDDGLIESVHDPITQYVPELRGSGFDGVSIAYILQMSSGLDFTESYDDKSTDAFKMFDQMFIFMQPLDNIAASYGSSVEPGTQFHYASINTHALAMLVRSVSGQELTSYLEQELWQPLGMENDAFWSLDNHGSELGFMGLNATLRDFAKLGSLFLNKGQFNGQRIVSESWVTEATTPDADFLQPGQIDEDWGYQYQWWIPRGSTRDFAAIGIWGQMIYVNPEANMVIVKTSADKDFKEHEYEAIQLFRTIAQEFKTDK